MYYVCVRVGVKEFFLVRRVRAPFVTPERFNNVSSLIGARIIWVEKLLIGLFTREPLVNSISAMWTVIGYVCGECVVVKLIMQREKHPDGSRIAYLQPFPYVRDYPQKLKII